MNRRKFLKVRDILRLGCAALTCACKSDATGFSSSLLESLHAATITLSTLWNPTSDLPRAEGVRRRTSASYAALLTT